MKKEEETNISINNDPKLIWKRKKAESEQKQYKWKIEQKISNNPIKTNQWAFCWYHLLTVQISLWATSLFRVLMEID